MTTETTTVTTYDGTEYDTAALDKEFGTVTKGGQELYLIQQAYLSHDGNMQPLYEASAIDLLGKKYRVEWDIINEETDDDGDACDWDSPARVRMVESN